MAIFLIVSKHSFFDLVLCLAGSCYVSKFWVNHSSRSFFVKVRIRRCQRKFDVYPVPSGITLQKTQASVAFEPDS
jgi:hypothetical protein